MMDAGLGGEQLNTLLTACDVPPVYSKTLKEHERIVGRALKELADESCLQMLKEEKRLTLENE